MNPPADLAENELELIFLNSGRFENLNLSEATEDEQPSEALRNITMYPHLGDSAKGCVIRDGTIGWEYGAFQASIVPGEHHQPDAELLQSEYCADCRAAILTASPNYDLLVLDLADRRLYDLCEQPYDFSIRKYHIQTNHRLDGSIDLTITDTSIYQRGASE